MLANCTGPSEFPVATTVFGFVVDYRMPAIDGLELVAELRRRNVALPAILISAQVTRGLRDQAERAGLTRILEKPLTDTALVENIRGALASHV